MLNLKRFSQDSRPVLGENDGKIIPSNKGRPASWDDGDALLDRFITTKRMSRRSHSLWIRKKITNLNILGPFEILSAASPPAAFGYY
jgi:hypothetical protein